MPSAIPNSDISDTRVSRITLGTGESVELASLASRLFAYCLDFMIIAFICILSIWSVLATYVLFTSNDNGLDSNEPERYVEIIAILVLVIAPASVAILAISWYVYSHRRHPGQTLGKQAMEIKCIRIADGVPPGYIKTFIRSSALYFILLVSMLNTAFVIFIILMSSFSPHLYYSTDDELTTAIAIMIGVALLVSVLIWTLLACASTFGGKTRQGFYHKVAGTAVIKVNAARRLCP